MRDTGCGMTAGTMARIFEPFFTTKEPGRGTGLGLAIIRQIVHQLGGSIHVASEPQRGTTFTIYLPCAETVSDSAAHSPGAKGQPVATSTSPENRARTILVVDDDPLVRDMLACTLRGSGYFVLEGSTAAEALQTSAGHLGGIHLLITDVLLPRTSGPELARQLAGQRPGIKVLYMSGYPDDILKEYGVKATGGFLRKPFTLSELVRKAREVLE
jgi:two-component system cell cycle sensor histidine kinase/response regulator CckA